MTALQILKNDLIRAWDAGFDVIVSAILIIGGLVAAPRIAEHFNPANHGQNPLAFFIWIGLIAIYAIGLWILSAYRRAK